MATRKASPSPGVRTQLARRHVLVDTRESGNGEWYIDGDVGRAIPGTFAYEGMTFDRQYHEFGDFWVYLKEGLPPPPGLSRPKDWLVIERKTWADFHSSVQDSGAGREDTRIRHQVRGLLKLQEQGYQTCVLIVGLLTPTGGKSVLAKGKGVQLTLNGKRVSRNWSYESLEAARLAVEHVGILTAITPSDEDVPRAIRMVADVVSRAEHFKPKGVASLAPGLPTLAMVFTAVPDVGEITALNIAKTVQTFEAFWRMDAKELTKIPGVGKVTAERLWATFHSLEFVEPQTPEDYAREFANAR